MNTTPPKTDRNASIINAYAKGEKMRDIARRHGITQQRVAFIIKRGPQKSNPPRSKQPEAGTADVQHVVAAKYGERF
jgi:Mor family transcriptional regulator